MDPQESLFFGAIKKSTLLPELLYDRYSTVLYMRSCFGMIETKTVGGRSGNSHCTDFTFQDITRLRCTVNTDDSRARQGMPQLFPHICSMKSFQ